MLMGVSQETRAGEVLELESRRLLFLRGGGVGVMEMTGLAGGWGVRSGLRIACIT